MLRFLLDLVPVILRTKTDRLLLQEILDAPLPALPPADQVLPQSTFRLSCRYRQHRDPAQHACEESAFSRKIWAARLSLLNSDR